MKEAEIKVTYEKLPENWFKSSFNSIEMIKRTITMLNEINGFDLYDIEENLSEEKIVEKIGLKEHNIMLPLTYAMEEFLKSVVILYDVSSSNIRENKVKEALQKVKNQSTIKGNLHNASIFIDYIKNNIDPNFLEILGLLYFSRRKGYDGGRERSNAYTHNIENKQERLKIATEEFKNAFIDMRYLFEKTDEPRRMDLTKLMDYTESVRDACLYLIMRKKYISLLDSNDTFYNNNQFNEIISELNGLNNNSINRYEYIDVIDLLNNLSAGFNSYIDPLFKYCDEVANYISPLSGPVPLEQEVYVKEYLKNLFEVSNIEALRNLAIEERFKISDKIEEKRDLLLDRLCEIEDECEHWISKINEIYLPEYCKHDYKVEHTAHITK